MLLTFPPLFVIAPCNGGQHIKQHVIDGRKHSAVQFIGSGGKVLPGGDNLNGHYLHATLTDDRFEFLPLISF